MARNEDEAKKRFNYFENDNFCFISHDINEEFRNIESADIVIHCASNTHPRAYSQRPIETILTCVNGTKNVLDFSVKSNAEKVIFLSSVEIYGENTVGKNSFSEYDMGYIDCNTLRAGYPEGKRLGESLCHAYIKEHDLDIRIARLCRIYGPTVKSDDSKAISQFIYDALNNRDIVLKSEGKQEFSYLYVIDAVLGIFTILFNGATGEAYNVCSENSNIVLKDLAQLIANRSHRKVIYDLPDTVEKKGFSVVSKAVIDDSKLKGIGYNAFYNIIEGVERTLAIMKS